MSSLLTDCAKNIVERLSNLIIDETRYVCCFNCIVDDFEKEKPALEAKRETISKDVEYAKNNTEEIREEVTEWLEKTGKLINEDTEAKVACFGGWCPNCIWRYHRGKELTQMTNDIRRLQGTTFDRVGHGSNRPGTESHSSQSFIRFQSRDLEYKQLLDAVADDNTYIIALQGMGGAGKTTLAKEVGSKLKESGKFDFFIFTTVSDAPDIKKIQDSIAGFLGLPLEGSNEWQRCHRLKERLTDGRKILIILDDVWEPISFEEIGIPSGENHSNCKVLLTSRNANVRDSDSMEAPKLIQLELLSDQDAWILFRKHAGIDDEKPTTFKDKGQEITKECKKLPVAIAAIASSLKNRPLEEWDAALTALRNPMPMLDVDENLRNIYKTLRYSYENVKSDIAKRLFILLSVFPADTEVPIELLTKFGIGAGFFGEVDKYCEARSKVLLLKKKLINSCLWLDAEDGCVKLHDLVRDVALWIAKEDNQFIGLSEKKRLANKEMEIKYLCCEDLHVSDMEAFSTWFDASKLVILIIFMEASNSVEVPNTFFEKMTRLRVLFLKNNNWSKLPLSLSILDQSLTNIRTLMLVDWELGDISVLKNLRSLEILDLDNCSIRELPIEITKLEKLRLLEMEDCEIERNNPFEVIERCFQLEELYFIDNELPILDTTNEVEAIHQQNTTFPTLNRYCLQSNGETRDSRSKVVCLPEIEALVSEAMFKHLVQGAEILQLKTIEGEWRNLIPEIVPMAGNGMNDLFELSLESCSKVQCLVNTMRDHYGAPNVFSKLVSLVLVNMDSLEELCIGPVPSEFLKSLQRLHIEQCKNLRYQLNELDLCHLKILELVKFPKLASIFPPSTARSLVLLEELRMCECDQLTNIIAGEASNDKKKEKFDGKNVHKSDGSVFPKLKVLEIKKCDQLECILSILSLGDIPILETITIVDCGEFKHMFGRCQHEDQDVVLGSLQNLKLNGLPNFTCFSRECYPLTSSSSKKRTVSRSGSKAKQVNLSNRKMNFESYLCCYRRRNGGQLRNGTNIKMPAVSMTGQIYRSTSSVSKSFPGSAESLQCVSKQSQGLIMSNFPNTRRIVLRGLDKVKYLFTLSTTSLMLEILNIEACPGLKRVITIMRDDEDRKNCNSIFPKLQEINISGCEQLEYVFGPNHQEDDDGDLEFHMHFPALEELTLLSLSKMINISPTSYVVSLPSLKEFKLFECPEFNSLGIFLDSRQLHSTSNKASSSECVQTFEIARSISKHSQNLLNIRIMSLSNCPKMISLFTFSVASTMLLEHLWIDSCHRLKHVIRSMRDDEDRKNCNSIFPKLKIIHISECEQLEYVIGPNHQEDDDSNLEFHMHFPALEELILSRVSKMINISPTSYVVSLPSLKVFILHECPEFNSVSDLGISLDSRQLHSTTNKDTRVVEKLLPNLKTLRMRMMKVESIIHIDEHQIIEQPLTTTLKHLQLFSLAEMKCICLASKNSFTFQHLETLEIDGCEKLELIFTASISRCLPELKKLEITECKELKEIVEKDAEHQKTSTQPCFPKLAALFIRECNKLKRFVSVSSSACNDFPNLELLIVNGASELEELIGYEQGQGDAETGKVQVKFPELRVVIFRHLLRLCLEVETMQTVRHRIVYNCPNFSLTSTTSPERFEEISSDLKEGGQLIGFRTSEIYWMLDRGITEVTADRVVDIKPEGTSGSMMPSSKISEESEEEFPTKISEIEQIDRPSGSPSAISQTTSIITKTGAEKESTSDEIIIVPSTHSESTSSQLGALVTSQHKSNELELMDGQSIAESCMINQLKPFGETSLQEIVEQSTQEDFKSEKTRTATLSYDSGTRRTSPGPLLASLQKTSKRGVEEGASEDGKMSTLSTPLKPTTSQPGPSVTPQREPYPHSEIRPSQTETPTYKKSEGHPRKTQDLKDDGDGQISASVVSKDNLVFKVLADLEESLKMPMKDIACSEAGSLRLLTALNFLSRLSLEHVTLSDGLKAIIESLHKEFPIILRSFKQALATTNKVLFEERVKSIKEKLDHRKEVVTTLACNISMTRNLIDEAVQKEAALKEQMNRLEEEIKDYEAELSSLEEDENKSVEELYEIDYKWSVLCSQFEHNRITADNSS